MKKSVLVAVGMVVLTALVLSGCSRDANEGLPKVQTNGAISLSDTTFECGGTVLSDGGNKVTSRGLCWSATSEPRAVEGFMTKDGTGTGTYRSKIIGLVPETRYYYRAYATNSEGTSYGEEQTFVTKRSLFAPTVSTGLVTEIELITAECGGYVTATGGDSVVRYGVCWDTNPNPTTSSTTKVVLNYNTPNFTCTLANLMHSTTYHVRAFAVNTKGVSYGENRTFTTKVLPPIEMVSVSGGTFSMGSNNGLSNEQPVHSVSLGNFKMGKTEVTVEMWNAVMPNSMNRNEVNLFPVSGVSFNTVMDFITRLGLATKKNYRLPTEAEWEYAAGGGQSARYLYAAGLNDTVGFSARAWFALTSDFQKHTVSGLLPNNLGFFDLAGNVAEWCNDWYGDYTGEAVSNPKGPTSGIKKVFRGGSFSDEPDKCKTTARQNLDPNSPNTTLGFRLALTE